MRHAPQQFDPRQNMQRRDFEVFHYLDVAAREVEVHHHDHYEVYYLRDGRLDYWIEGQSYRLEPGDLLLMDPMELHRPMPVPEGQHYERMVLWIDRQYLQSLGADPDLAACFDRSRPGYTNLLRPSQALRGRMAQLLEDLVREHTGSQYGHRLYASGLFLQFMVELNRLARQVPAHSRRREEPSPLIAQVLVHINQYYAQPLSLEDLAKQFYISKYHLSHAFSREVGISIHRYITLKRLLAARQLLQEGQAPGQVYRSCGFTDYANFYRAFKAEYGASPSQVSNG